VGTGRPEKNGTKLTDGWGLERKSWGPDEALGPDCHLTSQKNHLSI
jgi:hypothetical protein